MVDTDAKTGDRMAQKLRSELWRGGFPMVREGAVALSVPGGSYANLHPGRNCEPDAQL